MVLGRGAVLQAVLAGVVAANQPEVHVDSIDHPQNGDASVNETQASVLASATDVTILSGPTSNPLREVTSVSIYNKDTASVVVTVKTDDDGTESIVLTQTLLTLETLAYERGVGWYVI